MAPSKDNGADRRRDYRVTSVLSIRHRLWDDKASAARFDDHLVGRYEDLCAAGRRFRRGQDASGRQFVDRNLELLDALVGEVVRLRDDAGWKPRLMVESDISLSGLGFDTSYPMEIGSYLELEVGFPHALTAVPIQCRAEVMWCGPQASGRNEGLLGADVYKIGVRYDRMASSTRERLVRLIYDLQRLQIRARDKQPSGD